MKTVPIPERTNGFNMSIWFGDELGRFVYGQPGVKKVTASGMQVPTQGGGVEQ